jgi:hypothetical protein
MGDLASRAASREATTVEEEVTFFRWQQLVTKLIFGRNREKGEAISSAKTYNGGNGELVLAGILEQGQDVIADDDTGLAAQDIGSTHFCEFWR